MRRAALTALAVKEMRALWPAWATCLAAMAAPALVDRRFGGLGILAYVVGSAVIGGQSIGQEYSGRTLASLLTHPVRRTGILLVKLGVLAAMLASLAVFANAFVFGPIRAAGAGGRGPEMTALLWVPLLSGLSLAPWLTMLCRSALGGAVFSIVLPGLVQIVVVLTAVGASPDATVDVYSLTSFWAACLTSCATGAFMTWWTFTRLELLDGASAPFSMPAWRSQPGLATGSSGPPLWVLAKKEIHLQQMAFIATGVYGLGCLVTILARPRVADDAISAMSILYAAVIPPLVGSVASAEERQLGTLDWQLLLPIASWQQWAVKVAVAVVIAVALSLGLPALVLGIDLDRQLLISLAIPVVGLTVISLYASTLWSSVVWAFLTTIAAAVLAAPTAGVLFRLAMSNPQVSLLPGIGPAADLRTTVIGLSLAAGFLTAVLRCGLVNHRSVERSAWLVGRQVAALGGSLVLAIATWLVVKLT